MERGGAGETLGALEPLWGGQREGGEGGISLPRVSQGINSSASAKNAAFFPALNPSESRPAIQGRTRVVTGP